MRREAIAVLGRLGGQRCALQPLQKAQLQLVRPQGIDLRKGLAEPLQPLIRQAGDQIRMHLHISGFDQLSRIF